MQQIVVGVLGSTLPSAVPPRGLQEPPVARPRTVALFACAAVAHVGDEIGFAVFEQVRSLKSETLVSLQLALVGASQEHAEQSRVSTTEA